MLAGRSGDLLGRRSGNRFGQIEQCVIFPLAEILGLKKFGQADNLRTMTSRMTFAPAPRDISRAARVPSLREQYSIRGTAQQSAIRYR